MNQWPIFLCYRQIDGSETAKWLHGLLNGREVVVPGMADSEEVTLDVYFDAATPAVSDWHQIHRPALERARAFLVVCTPGLFAKLTADDWVHMEIDWWLRHRKAAPILVDTTGEGERWVPERIRSRWPNAQRVLVEWPVWRTLPETERKAKQEIIRERILGGIQSSEYEVRYEDLERQRRVVRRLKVALAATLVTLTIAVVSAVQYVRTARIAELRSREASQAAEIAQRHEQEAKHILAMKLLQEAEYAWEKNDVISARVLSARAMSVYDSSDVRNRGLSIHHLSKGNELLARHHLKLALSSVFLEAVDMTRLPHRIERMVRGAAIRELFEKYLLLTIDDPEGAYAAVLLFKGLDAWVERKQRMMLHVLSRGTQSLQERLARLETRVAGLIYGVPYDAAKHREWEDDYRTATAELTDLYVQLGDLWRGPVSPIPRVNWKDIQSRLKLNEVIVDFVLYRESYVAFVLRSVGSPVRIELGRAADIERMVQFVTSGIVDFWTGPASRSSRESDFRSVQIVEPDKHKPFERDAKWSTLFWKSVWRPIEEAMGPGVTKVYIIPDGVFATLPFAAMADRSPDSMLVDHYLFVHLSTAHNLLEEVRRENASDSILLLGGLSYGAPKEAQESKLGRIFAPLPGAEMEVKMISEIIGKHAVALMGESGSEVAFRKSASGRRVLHLATHGWATSGLLPPADVGGLRLGIDAYFTSLDPFLLAGVALAGANRRSENAENDGILTAMEIAGLNLGGTELAVLAGCETVGTARAGESTLALVRSLRQAGVHNVIATLYVVEDQATARFMASFYKNYLTGLAPAEAMRRAQLEYRRAGRDPRIWAPFVAYGSGR